MRVFVLDGVIGVGKSTLLDALRSMHMAGVAFVDEPVAAWESQGLLQAMYRGEMSKGQFQIMALSTRVMRMLSMLRQPGVHTVIMERSPWSDCSVFASLHLKDAWDKRSYAAIFAEVEAALADIQPHVILLDAPVETVLARVNARNRDTESNHITRHYLLQLQHAYDQYYELMPSGKSRVDATRPPAEVLAIVAQLLDVG